MSCEPKYAILCATVGEETTAPLVVKFHFKYRFVGPDWPAPLCVASCRYMGQSVVLNAQTWSMLVYSAPENESTAVVTLAGIMYNLPYATATDSLGAKASIGSFHMRSPVKASKHANSDSPRTPANASSWPVVA